MTKKILCFLLAMSMASALAIPVSAGSSNVPINVEIEAAVLNVTVPTDLPISVDAMGESKTEVEAYIKNNSAAQVEVTNIQMFGVDGWVLKSWDTNWKENSIGVKEFAMKLNGENVPANGIVDVSSFGKINGSDREYFTYEGRIAPQSEGGTATIGNVVFTIGWANGDKMPSPIHFGERYVMTERSDGGYDLGAAYIFYEDGSAIFDFGGDDVNEIPAGFLIYEGLNIMPNPDLEIDDSMSTIIISADGKRITEIDSENPEDFCVLTLESEIEYKSFNIVSNEYFNGGNYVTFEDLTWDKWCDSVFNDINLSSYVHSGVGNFISIVDFENDTYLYLVDENGRIVQENDIINIDMNYHFLFASMYN